MTKKHFIALAETLHSIRHRAESARTTGEVMLIVEKELALFGASMNPALDKEWFLDYSRVGPPKRGGGR